MLAKVLNPSTDSFERGQEGIIGVTMGNGLVLLTILLRGKI